jgi:hypothetical protein
MTWSSIVLRCVLFLWSCSISIVSSMFPKECLCSSRCFANLD